jgi:hypothetical protein
MTRWQGQQFHQAQQEPLIYVQNIKGKFWALLSYTQMI